MEPCRVTVWICGVAISALGQPCRGVVRFFASSREDIVSPRGYAVVSEYGRHGIWRSVTRYATRSSSSVSVMSFSSPSGMIEVIPF